MSSSVDKVVVHLGTVGEKSSATMQVRLRSGTRIVSEFAADDEETAVTEASRIAERAMAKRR